MARLTAAARRALPNSAFAGPNRTFPVNDANHAKAAIGMSGHAANPSKIKAAARHKLHPGMKDEMVHQNLLKGLR